MVLLGCRPFGRHTEQHDVFFGIAPSLKALVPHMNRFWPEAKNNLHIDAWREVSSVDGFTIRVRQRNSTEKTEDTSHKLFFMNLGGYKAQEFEEYHYKLLTIAETTTAAIQTAKQSSFFKHTGFKGATAHIDDKYGVDVDDIYEVTEILDADVKERYLLEIISRESEPDLLHLGYLPTWKVKE